ncbi:MAG: carboxypeptidase regulatory-like domain-containing protein [Acidobacteriota bacterium]
MARALTRSGLFGVVLFLLAAGILAQSTTGRLTGVVRDSSDALVPGAQVLVKNEQTGAEFDVITNDVGAWAVPSVQNGTYTITISLPGFKSAVFQKVKVDAGTTATVNSRLEVGEVSESVTILGGSSVIQTESANVSSTIVGRQISELPFTTRDAMQLVLTLPGVQTPGTPRTSSVNGLPKSSLNIMLDGANIQDNYLKSSDGFFTSIQAKSDAVEEVTVSTATPGAESAAGGAVQIKFVTKSGSNDFHGGLFWQHRNDFLNANYYGNTLSGLPRDRIILNQAGGHVGGPIVVPKLFNGRDRAFFFVNIEEFRLPQTYAVGRTVLTSDALQGIFTYRDSASAVRTVNLYQIAGARGFPSTPDPQIGKALGLVDSASQKGILKSRVGTVNDYNRLDLSFQDPGRNLRRFPTARFDFNLTKDHHLELVHNFQHYFSLPDGVNSILSIYPGVGTHLGLTPPAGGSIYRNAFSFVLAERWTITSRLVNEIRLTSSGNGTSVFRREFSPGLFGLFNGLRVDNPFTSAFFTYSSSSRRHTPSKTLEDTLNWQVGRHAVNFGFSFTQINSFTEGVGNALVPTVGLGIAANDPINTGATSIFTTTNFPGSTSGQRGDAQNLYALLTGRVSSTGRSATFGENSRKFEFSPTREFNHQREFGFYAQDSWKIRPSFTFNYGLRWELDLSPVNDNLVYTRTGPEGIYGVSGFGNVFKPGVFSGAMTEYRLVKKGEKAYNTHYKDFAPTVGFAWTPSLGKGPLRHVFGEAGQTVLRGGYSLSYVREGFSAFNSMFGSNEGVSVTLGTNPGNYPVEFGKPGSRLLRDGSLPFQTAPQPVFPFYAIQGASINDFNPDLRPGYVQSWTFGIQREISKNLALEVRYVGNHGTRMWRQYEIGEVNIFENGFLKEFNIARENLRIARAANPTSNNFGNQGLPGQANIPIISTALGLTNDLTFATTVSRGEAGRLAANIAQNVTRMNNLINANLVPFVSFTDPSNPAVPIRLSNFFVANPRSPTNSWIMDNGTDTNYNSMQIELRRRMSRGILVQGSYVWSKSLTNTFASSAEAALTPTTLRDFGYDKGPAPRDMRHAIKVDWIQELPIGPGRRYFNGALPVVSKILGICLPGCPRAEIGAL